MLQSDLNRQLPLLAGLLLWSLARLDTSRTAYICASLLSTSAFLTVIHLRREWVFVMCRCLFIVGGHNIMNPSTVRCHIQGRTWTIRVKKNNHTNSNWNICCGESTRLRHSAQHYKLHKNTICGRGIDFYVLYCAVYVVSTPLLILYTHYYIMIILASVVEEAFRPFPKIKVPIPRCENTPLQVKALRSKPYWAKSVSVVEQTSILRSQNS